MNTDPWAQDDLLFSNEEIDELLQAYLEVDEKDLKCECGSEKVYGKSASHSGWCPKSERK